MVKIALIILVTIALVMALQFWKRRSPELSVFIALFQWLLPATALMLVGLYVLAFLVAMGKGNFEHYQSYAMQIAHKAFAAGYPEELRNEFDDGKAFRLDFCTSQQLWEWEQGGHPVCSVARSSIFDSCALWWMPRKCGAIQTTPEIYRNERIRVLFEQAARQPCQVMSKPKDPRSGLYAWWAAGCDDASTEQQFDVVIYVGGPARHDLRTRVTTINRPWWWAKDIWREIVDW